AVALAGIPLAVASSRDVNAASADILVSYRNFGEVTLWGGDLAIEALLSNQWTAAVSGSFASDHFFKDKQDTNDEIVALNAPKFKGSASLGYRNTGLGFNGEIRVRHIGEFPVNSAPFIGIKCIVGEKGIQASDDDEPCVQAYTLVDLTLGYRLPMVRRVSAQLAVQNLFDKKYQSFLGVPEIGRFGLLRLNYQF
ncbi:MAG: TonB-dependent receptor, partial [Gemmatimonadetes bacterium]|nr:TonB-dependent receptor [Gemmatimonadota bacterium]